MPWGRLDDQANGNAKLLAISDAAWRMWGCGLIYCQANLTNGFIPDHAIHSFGVRARNKVGIAKELCLALVPNKGPLWHKAEGGYQVHDYLDWNDSREEILKERERGRLRQERFRQRTRGGDAASNAESNTVSNALHDAFETLVHNHNHNHVPEKNSKPDGSEPPPAKASDMSLTFLELPVIGKGSRVYRLTEAQVTEWSGLFPGLDVHGECRKALAWLLANPGRQKTARGVLAFLVRWLSKAVDEGRARRVAVESAPLPAGRSVPPSASWRSECTHLQHRPPCSTFSHHEIRKAIAEDGCGHAGVCQTQSEHQRRLERERVAS